MINYGVIAECQAAGEMTGKVTVRFSVNGFRRRDLAEVIAFGRAIGLQIEQHHDGGWLVRRGHLVLRGPGRDLARFCLRFNAVSDW